MSFPDFKWWGDNLCTDCGWATHGSILCPTVGPAGLCTRCCAILKWFAILGLAVLCSFIRLLPYSYILILLWPISSLTVVVCRVQKDGVTMDQGEGCTESRSWGRLNFKHEILLFLELHSEVKPRGPFDWHSWQSFQDMACLAWSEFVCMKTHVPASRKCELCSKRMGTLLEVLAAARARPALDGKEGSKW